MSQWGFYFNQDRCIGCKACSMGCKNWNEKNRGDRFINPRTEEAALTNALIAVPEGSAQPSNAFARADGSLPNQFLGQYAMKEEWRRVTEYDNGGITVNRNTNTFFTTFERAYFSLACHHCKEPACMAACPMGVFYKDEKYGLTLYNSSACISCGRCKTACPWGAPQFYDDNFANYLQGDPARPHMTKCTGCFDRIEANLKPACVAACRARALDFGPIDELRSKYNNNVVDSVAGFDRSSTQPGIIFRAKKNDTKQI